MTITREEALKILDFSQNSNPNEQEIKRAYRKLALKYHPDKYANESKDKQELEEKKFKELGAAYAFLTDDSVETATLLHNEDLDQDDLDVLVLLHTAIVNKDVNFLKKFTF